MRSRGLRGGPAFDPDSEKEVILHSDPDTEYDHDPDSDLDPEYDPDHDPDSDPDPDSDLDTDLGPVKYGGSIIE